MTITGRGGQTLEELWAKDGARAYLGCMMPGFPNLWSI
jgi:4-hydroxyacetophenone monooxygenase